MDLRWLGRTVALCSLGSPLCGYVCSRWYNHVLAVIFVEYRHVALRMQVVPPRICRNSATYLQSLLQGKRYD